VSRPRVDVAVPALALRRAEAAAALGVSLETFDAHVRPHLAAVQLGTVTVYPAAELQRFLADTGTVDPPNNSGAARMTAAGAVAHQEVPR